MKKLTLKQKIRAIKIDPIRLTILILALFACINLIKYLFSSGISSNGSFEVASNPEISTSIVLPLYFTEETLKGKELILQTRRSQIEHFNAKANSSVFADESAFSELDENLPWFDESDSTNPVNSLYHKGLIYGLLNPLLLVIPQISIINDQNNAASEIKNIYSIKDLTFNNNQKLASITVTLPTLLINNSKTLLDNIAIRTNNFNAFLLGFNFSQPDFSNPLNLEFKDRSDQAAPFFYNLGVDACKAEEFEKEDALKCNQLLIPMGSSLIRLKDLPASASFKLWKQQPEADTAPDMTFQINFEISDSDEPIIAMP